MPLVDAQLSFPANLSYAAFSNISLMGIAPRVVSLSSNYLSSRGDSLSAGDSIFVYVQYSQSIRITLSQNLTNLPYLLLETGTSSSSPGIALFFNQSAVDTLIFKYVIRSDDVIDNGLYLYCSCRDFFNRCKLFVQCLFNCGIKLT